SPRRRPCSAVPGLPWPPRRTQAPEQGPQRGSEQPPLGAQHPPSERRARGLALRGFLYSSCLPARGYVNSFVLHVSANRVLRKMTYGYRRQVSWRKRPMRPVRCPSATAMLAEPSAVRGNEGRWTRTDYRSTFTRHHVTPCSLRDPTSLRIERARRVALA